MAAHAWNDIKTVTLKTTWQKIRVVSDSEPNRESVESNEGLTLK